MCIREGRGRKAKVNRVTFSKFEDWRRTRGFRPLDNDEISKGGRNVNFSGIIVV